MESGTGANAVVPFFAHRISHCIILSFPLSNCSSLQTHTKSWQFQCQLELSPGAFNSSDDVGNGVMDFCSKQSASVISGASKSTAHACFTLCQWCAASNEIKSCCRSG